MKTVITEFEQQLIGNEIVDFEHTNKISLPENLKKLYLKYNGGTIEKTEEEYYLFSIKYGVLKIEDSIRILHKLEQLIPKEYLPIADTPVGNIITICLSDDNRKEKIFLFRQDDLQPILFYNSLEEFLNVKSIDEL